MNYTTLKTDGRVRLVHTLGTDSRVVTTIADADLAREVATALTNLTHDPAHNLVDDLAALAGVQDLVDAVYDDQFCRNRDFVFTGADWSDLEAHAAPVDLTRRLLAVFDNPDGDHGLQRYGAAQHAAKLSTLLAGAPASVIRAVRDEIAHVLAPYDGIPVLAVAYDYKYGEETRLFVANAALDAEVAVKLTNDRFESEAINQLFRLEQRGHADFSYLEGVADSGYLSVPVHPALLEQWIAAQNAS